MNRRGFLRAVGATGLWCLLTRPALLPAAPKKTADELLRQALSERRVVQFKYHGYSRRVEPHALGRATGDRPALLGWQVSGGSASEPPPGWRTFVLADITEPRLTRATFVPRADYRPETTKLKPIEVEVISGP
ncbi:MAG TPA: WYL domain-containing protein [Lacunisphaera sp.]